jgi:hypothetical protein
VKRDGVTVESACRGSLSASRRTPPPPAGPGRPDDQPHRGSGCSGGGQPADRRARVRCAVVAGGGLTIDHVIPARSARPVPDASRMATCSHRVTGLRSRGAPSEPARAGHRPKTRRTLGQRR